MCVGVFSGSGGPCGADAGLLQAGQCGHGAARSSGPGADRISGSHRPQTGSQERSGAGGHPGGLL